MVYQRLAQEYGQYQKLTLTGTQEERTPLGDKAAYWAYRSFQESYKLSGNSQELKAANDMLAYLTKYWQTSSYALNLTYDQAREQEKEADGIESAQAAAEKLMQAASTYQLVQAEADQYDPSRVYVARCYYRAAEVFSKSSGTESNPSPLPPAALQYLEKAKQILLEYQAYAALTPIPSIATQRIARRQEALGLCCYYLFKTYLLQGETQRAIECLKQIRAEFRQQTELYATATYFLAKIKLEQNALEEAETLVLEISSLGFGSFYRRFALEELVFGSFYRRFALEEAETLVLEIEELKGKVSASFFSNYQSFNCYLLGVQYESQAEQLNLQLTKATKTQQKAQLQRAWMEALKRSAQYLGKWLGHKPSKEPSFYVWVGTKFFTLAQSLEVEEVDATEQYRQAMSFFEQAHKQSPTMSKDIQWKLAQCAACLKQWEKAMQWMYPLFHQDKDQREEQRKKESGPRGLDKPTTNREDPQYLDTLTEILLGISQETSLSKPKETSDFLLKYIGRDIQDELKNFTRYNLSSQAMYEKYIALLKTVAWIHAEKWSDETEKQLSKTWEQDKQAKQSSPTATQELIAMYEKKYLEILSKEFPADITTSTWASLSPEVMLQRIQRACIYVGYSSASRLVENLSPYQNPQVPFGNYDNPAWWQAKYRQLYLMHLQGENTLVRSAIDLLRMQQKTMGGKQFTAKFSELYAKCQ